MQAAEGAITAARNTTTTNGMSIARVIRVIQQGVVLRMLGASAVNIFSTTTNTVTGTTAVTVAVFRSVRITLIGKCLVPSVELVDVLFSGGWDCLLS